MTQTTNQSKKTGVPATASSGPKAAESSPESVPDPAEPTAIVGIGASAGGLEAIQSFFEAMPVDSGMAFVVVQHLSPDYKSLMVELLSRKTEMTVMRATEGMTVEPNQVYLIPPKKNLTIFHGKLLLTEQRPQHVLNLPVDVFLRSLAEDQGERAVAVILSGTGSDGTRGVRAIKEFGGLVLVQDEESAKFDGMPLAAASTGLADFVLPPQEMPGQLIATLKHPYAARQQRQTSRLSEETGMTRIFSLLRARTKVDFTYYKPSTIARRIERRITVTQVDDLDSYVAYIEENPAELTLLYRELLIGVTSFFRDPEVMEELQARILPNLIQEAGGRELRFWVAGCSTGEEAYTLAILVREVMQDLGTNRDVKIFATDIDRDAIVSAGNGLYPESIAADLTPALLGKYFYRRGGDFQVARSVREMVVFAQHNLVKDPPFTRIDLVSCRNLLIYLQSNLQQKALEMFNFSLRSGGILLLGTSETVGEMETCFEPLNRKYRIYRARGAPQLLRPSDALAITDSVPKRMQLGAVRPTPPSEAGFRVRERIMDRLVHLLSETYVPPAVLVNEQLEVMHTIGDTTDFFRIPSGRVSFDITRMVDKELSIPLSSGIQKVFRTGSEISYSNVRLGGSEGSARIRLRIRPVPGRKSDDPLVVVFIEDAGKTAPEHSEDESTYDLSEETRQRLVDLEQDLQFTRENLQATIEELETANEELQATNEELLASNEELQSTNEELQSTNEELYTVNSEYQNKIIELTEARNDVENLLTSSRIGTLILDEDLHIRHYSPEAAAVFHLMEGDTGRPISHLAHQLVEFDPVASALKVLRTERPFEATIRSENRRWYLVRIMPYQIGPRAYAGVVMTLVDITAARTMTRNLDETIRSASETASHLSSGLLIYRASTDGQLHLVESNPAAAEITGLDFSQLIGRPFEEIWPSGGGIEIKELFLEVVRTQKPLYLDEVPYEDERLTGVFHVHAFPLPDGRLAVSFENITQQKRAEQKLKENHERYQRLCQLMADAEKTARLGSWTWDVARDEVTWSDGVFRILGLDPSEQAPSFADHQNYYTEDSMSRLREMVNRALQDGTPYEVELDAIRPDGTIIRCLGRGEAERDGDGKVVRLFGSLQVAE